MARAFLFILDSFGIGGAPDAEDFSDVGSNTLGHIAEDCFSGKANKIGLRSGNLWVPNMEKMGLGLAAKNACGELPKGFNPNPNIIGPWASAQEISKGKDTPSGHWEIAGLPVLEDWGYFKEKENSFPSELLDKIISSFDIDGTIANKHSSGTVVLEEYGEEHLKTGKPIFYTSSDSVLQIAAHEERFGLDRLYALCQHVFKFTEPMNIGRVIARPFLGEHSGNFKRTGNRRDFSISPYDDTLLDVAKKAGREVVAIGKIADIYAHSGPTKTIKAHGNQALYEATICEMDDLPEGGLLITNFVDFDMLFGHRRDVVGYADALEKFDHYIPSFIKRMRPDDIVILTADHGCDPTWHGTDHTREQVPVLCYSPALKAENFGTLKTFSDIGATIAAYLDIPPLKTGKDFLNG